MLVCKDCGRELRKDDVCCPGCGSSDVVLNNYEEDFTIKTALKKMFFGFTNFKGRSGRSEYWKAVIGTIIATFVFMIFVAVVALVVLYPTMKHFSSSKPITEMDIISVIFAVLCMIAAVVYCVLFVVGGLALSVRRLHDIGKSGWLALIGVVPAVGGIILLVMALKDGQPEINKYGSNPKVKITA